MRQVVQRRRFGFGGRAGRRAVRPFLSRLPRILLFLGRLLRDRKVSLLDKALLVMVIGYVITPIDLIPDFLGVIGYIDDLYLVGITLDRLFTRAGPRTLLRHWDGPASELKRLVGGLRRLGAFLPAPIRRTLRGKVRRA
jgi:uncharacterized membrane protein YkvA (DUF1232 family)